VVAGEKQMKIGGSGGSLGTPGPLPTHHHTVYMEYFECLPTLLTPLLRGPVSPRWWLYFNAVHFEWCDDPPETQIAWQIYAALAYGSRGAISHGP
jgi:hypothetical protein